MVIISPIFLVPIINPVLWVVAVGLADAIAETGRENSFDHVGVRSLQSTHVPHELLEIHVGELAGSHHVGLVDVLLVDYSPAYGLAKLVRIYLCCSCAARHKRYMGMPTVASFIKLLGDAPAASHESGWLLAEAHLATRSVDMRYHLESAHVPLDDVDCGMSQ